MDVLKVSKLQQECGFVRFVVHRYFSTNEVHGTGWKIIEEESMFALQIVHCLIKISL